MHNEVNFKKLDKFRKMNVLSVTLEEMLVDIYICMSWFLNVAVATLNSNSRAHVSGELCF